MGWVESTLNLEPNGFIGAFLSLKSVSVRNDSRHAVLFWTQNFFITGYIFHGYHQPKKIFFHLPRVLETFSQLISPLLSVQGIHSVWVASVSQPVMNRTKIDTVVDCYYCLWLVAGLCLVKKTTKTVFCFLLSRLWFIE